MNLKKIFSVAFILLLILSTSALALEIAHNGQSIQIKVDTEHNKFVPGFDCKTNSVCVPIFKMPNGVAQWKLTIREFSDELGHDEIPDTSKYVTVHKTDIGRAFVFTNRNPESKLYEIFQSFIKKDNVWGDEQQIAIKLVKPGTKGGLSPALPKLLFLVGFHTHVQMAQDAGTHIEIKLPYIAYAQTNDVDIWRNTRTNQPSSPKKGVQILQYNDVTQVDFTVADMNKKDAKGNYVAICFGDSSHSEIFEVPIEVFRSSGPIKQRTFFYGQNHQENGNNPIAIEGAKCQYQGISYTPLLYGQVVEDRSPNANNIIALVYSIRREQDPQASSTSAPAGTRPNWAKYGG